MYCLTLPHSSLASGPLNMSAGAILFAIGLAIRIWAQQYLGYRIPKKYRKAQRKKLATNGPYKLCRNPVYVANALIITSLAILAGAPWFSSITFTWSMLVYHVVVSKYEEPHLAEKYGTEYLEYSENVSRWLPSTENIMSAITDPSQFPFYLALKSEIYNIAWTFPFVLRHFLY